MSSFMRGKWRRPHDGWHVVVGTWSEEMNGHSTTDKLVHGQTTCEAETGERNVEVAASQTNARGARQISKVHPKGGGRGGPLRSRSPRMAMQPRGLGTVLALAGDVTGEHGSEGPVHDETVQHRELHTQGPGPCRLPCRQLPDSGLGTGHTAPVDPAHSLGIFGKQGRQQHLIYADVQVALTHANQMALSAANMRNTLLSIRGELGNSILLGAGSDPNAHHGQGNSNR
jgi:hypothetical protein